MSIADSRSADAPIDSSAGLRIPEPRVAGVDPAEADAGAPTNLFITDHEGRASGSRGATGVVLGALELPGVIVGVAAATALRAPELLICIALWLAVQLVGARTDIRLHRPYATAPVLRRAAVVSWPMLLIGALVGADRPLVVLAGLSLPALSMLGRWLVTRSNPALAKQRVLLVGGPNVDHEYPIISGSHDHEFAGLLSISDASKADIVGAALKAGADKILLMPGTLNGVQVRNLGWALEQQGISLMLHVGVTDVDRSRLDTGADPLGVTVRPSSASTPLRTFREFLDRAAAALLVLLISPLLIGLALAVRLDSRGPAIFTQVRVGRDGQQFRIFKFRSMHIDAEERLAELRQHADGGNEVLFKMARDPRITRLGRFIRATSVDELPQLLNVVRGDMALIGPRPALPSEVAAYDEIAMRRLAVKPGITGLWQVSGRSDLSFDKSIALDVEYVDNWNLGLDVSIAMRTVRAVITREGAY